MLIKGKYDTSFFAYELDSKALKLAICCLGVLDVWDLS